VEKPLRLDTASTKDNSCMANYCPELGDASSKVKFISRCRKIYFVGEKNRE